MSVDGRRDRTVGGIEVADPPEISPCRASYAVAFSGASEKLSVSAETLPAPRYTRSSWAQTSAAARGRLRDAFGAAHRRPNRCKIQDQKLKTEPLLCLINSAGSSTDLTRKSVRTTRATRATPRLLDLTVLLQQAKNDPLAPIALTLGSHSKVGFAEFDLILQTSGFELGKREQGHAQPQVDAGADLHVNLQILRKTVGGTSR